MIFLCILSHSLCLHGNHSERRHFLRWGKSALFRTWRFTFPFFHKPSRHKRCSVLSVLPRRQHRRMPSTRNRNRSALTLCRYTKSGLLLPGQCVAVWDPADPTSKQMSNYFTHPDQIPVSTSEKVDNGIDATVTTIDKIIGYCRSGSVFPFTFGLACCAMEMIDVRNWLPRLMPLGV